MINQELKDWVYYNRNHLKRCPACNGSIEDRTISIYHSLIVALYNVYVWCGKNHRHEFEMKDIRSLLDHNNYARFGDLVRFGGIVYRPKNNKGKSQRALYGLNMARARDFFDGKYSIPAQIVVDQILGKTVAATYVSIFDIPELSKLLSDGMYQPNLSLSLNPDLTTQNKRKLPTVENYYNQTTT